MKNFKLLCVISLLLLAALLFAACGADLPIDETTPAETEPETTEPAPYDPNHEHVYVEDTAARIAPTCLKTGKATYHCQVVGCEETKTERLERIDHAPEAPATCIKAAKCATCSKILEEKTAHTYGEPEILAATCTEDGSRTEVCTVCGEVKVTTLLKEDAHHFTETNANGLISKVCEVCGYVTKTVEHTTLLKYDFETDLEMREYLSSVEGFTYKQGELAAKAIWLEEGTENHFGRFIRGTFVVDENLALVKNDRCIVEYDVKLDDFTRRANMSLFTILPGWVPDEEGGSTDVSWLYYMKLNSESTDGLKNVTAGEFVTYKDSLGALLNTGVVLEAGKWYHVTIDMNWAVGVTNIYLGERGSGKNMYIATAPLELADSYNRTVDPPDGIPCQTREEILTNAIRFSDNMATTDFDNIHIYTAQRPLWDIDE